MIREVMADSFLHYPYVRRGIIKLPYERFTLSCPVGPRKHPYCHLANFRTPAEVRVILRKCDCPHKRGCVYVVQLKSSGSFEYQPLYSQYVVDSHFRLDTAYWGVDCYRAPIRLTIDRLFASAQGG